MQFSAAAWSHIHVGMRPGCSCCSATTHSLQYNYSKMPTVHSCLHTSSLFCSSFSVTSAAIDSCKARKTSQPLSESHPENRLLNSLDTENELSDILFITADAPLP